MATLKQIEQRIEEHSKRLSEIREKEPKKLCKIEVMYSLVKFWEEQKVLISKKK